MASATNRSPSPVDETAVGQAVAFLAHPRTQATSLAKRVAFLKQKDLSDASIDVALQRSGLPLMKEQKASAETRPRLFDGFWKPLILGGVAALTVGGMARVKPVDVIDFLSGRRAAAAAAEAATAAEVAAANEARRAKMESQLEELAAMTSQLAQQQQQRMRELEQDVEKQAFMAKQAADAAAAKQGLMTEMVMEIAALKEHSEADESLTEQVRELLAKELGPLVGRAVGDTTKSGSTGATAEISSAGMLSESLNASLQRAIEACVPRGDIFCTIQAAGASFGFKLTEGLPQTHQLRGQELEGFGEESTLCHEELASLRKELVDTQKRQRHLMQKYLKHSPRKSSRSDFLLTIAERVGVPQSDRTWRDEWDEITKEFYGGNVPANAPTSIDALTTRHQSVITIMVKEGWGEEEAILVQLLRRRATPLSRCLEAGESNYAASLHALCRALYNAARRQQQERIQSGRSLPIMYKHLTGQYSLTDGYSAWKDIASPDQYGFRGITSTCPTEVNCESANWNPEQPTGFAQRVTDDSGRTTYIIQDSIVVKFVPEEEDEHGLHSPVLLGQSDVGFFPPNTLFRLKDVLREPEFYVVSANLSIRQMLYSVSATYKMPTILEAAIEDDKLCSSAPSLSYSDRSTYIEGLHQAMLSPILTMEEEFDRDLSWTNRRGEMFCVTDEWDYVNGVANASDLRDKDHDGWTVDDFMKEINDMIEHRRDHNPSIRDRMPEGKWAYLSKDEVIAIRLYSGTLAPHLKLPVLELGSTDWQPRTGPSFQPINSFLRELAKLNGDFKREMAHNTRISFISTVNHIMQGIRKISASEPDANLQDCTLYRAVRGVLPSGFFQPDNAGAVCVTETAFMSTSRQMATPTAYMDTDGPNVLWELRVGPPSEQYHFGADISKLSQFSGESEVLFPPYTMMQLDAEERGRPAQPTSALNDQVRNVQVKVMMSQAAKTAAQVGEANNGSSYIKLRAYPSFI